MAESSLIHRSPVPKSLCNLAKSFDLIGDRWMLLILRSALYGVCRFQDFQAELEIPRSILSNRLRRLVASGLMESRQYQEEGQRARVEYRLSRMGEELGLPFMAMTEWGDRWIGKGWSPLTLQSRSSGSRLTVALVDDTGRAVQLGDIERKIHLRPPMTVKRRKT